MSSCAGRRRRVEPWTARAFEVIRRKLHDGALPTHPPRDKIYAGYGSGARCDACGDPDSA
jgi:hypothetical protein